MVEFLRKRYVKILHISEDHICGLQIFEQNTVSVYFFTCTGRSYWETVCRNFLHAWWSLLWSV